MIDSISHMLSLLAVVGIPLSVGLITLFLIIGNQRWGTAFIISLAYLIGTGILGQLMMILECVRMPITQASLIKVIGAYVLLAAALVAGCRNKEAISLYKNEEWREQRLSHKVIIGIIIVYLVYKTYLVFWQAAVLPMYPPDAYTSFAYKAKVFFYEHSLKRAGEIYPQVYPIQVPLEMTWASLILGEWNERWIKIIFCCKFLALISILYAFMRAWSGRFIAFITLALAVSSNFMIIHASITYADFTLMLYCATALLTMCLGIEKKNTRMIVLSGVVFALAASVKREGVVYELIGLILLITYYHQRFRMHFLRSAAAFLVPLMVVKIIFNVFKQQNHISGLWTMGKYFDLPPNLLKSSFLAVKIGLDNLFLSGNWGLLWFALVAIWSVQYLDAKRFPIKFLRLSLILFVVNYLLVSVFVKDFIPACLCLAKDPASRILLHFFWVCPVLIGLFLEGVINKKESV